MVELETLVSILGGELEAPTGSRGQAVDVRDVQLDSRRVVAGDLFAALPGTLSDGARFATDAVERGAAAVLAPAPIPNALPVPTWIHPDARRIAGEAAALVLGEPSQGMKTIVITGTNGKTTTAHLAGQLLAHVGLRVAVLGTTGHLLAGGVSVASSHTTPDAPELQRLLARHRSLGGDAVVLEMSSHALDQERHAGLKVDTAVFVNLTRDHLDYHGSMEAYMAAKRRLFEALGPNSCAVVNADDPASDAMAEAARGRGARVVSFSARSRVDLFASHVVSNPGGTSFFLEGMGISKFEAALPLPGRHNVENALAAMAAVLTTGASPTHALGGLAALSPAPGRLERVSTGERGFALYVDYAHTPDALERVLATLREQVAPEGGRLICVFGCGGDRDVGKRGPMGAVAGRMADLVVVTSDNPRSEDPAKIIEAVRGGMHGTSARVQTDVERRAAIATALDQARPGDVVLVAGKGHESTQTIGERVVPFDDRVVAREILGVSAEER